MLVWSILFLKNYVLHYWKVYLSRLFPMNADYIKLAIIQKNMLPCAEKNLLKKYVMQIEV